MPWIHVIGLKEATGFLKSQYEAALKRAGRIWGTVSFMSQNPRTLKTSMDVYGAIMFGTSPLTRAQGEFQVIAYFNYINRVADALGLAPEKFLPAWEEGDSKEPS